MSYWVNVSEMWREAARYVNKILRGADPGNLPAQEALIKPRQRYIVIFRRGWRRITISM
jgi:ABC-type uncharacterized transport system substrate-binding protein